MSAAYDTISARLQKASEELRALEQCIQSGEIDPRVRGEFCEALEHLRHTSRTVQEWVELKAQQRDAYAVLTLLTAERIRRTTRLCRDLAMDMDAGEVSFETEGIEALFHAVERLYGRLVRVCKR